PSTTLHPRAAPGRGPPPSAGRWIHSASNRTWKPYPERSSDAKLSFTEQPADVSIRVNSSSASTERCSVTASGYAGGDLVSDTQAPVVKAVTAPCVRQTR